MKRLFCSASFEFTEIVGSRDDRETCSLRLEHDDSDDDDRKYEQKCVDESIHKIEY